MHRFRASSLRVHHMRRVDANLRRRAAFQRL
jgi:hypothetical protein